MAILYPAQGEPQTVVTPEGGFRSRNISELINGSPFYMTVTSRGILAICQGAFTLGLPQNRHEDTFLSVAYGDVLVMQPDELAPEEYEVKERWA